MRYDYEGKPFSAYDEHGRGYLIAPVYRYRDVAAGRTFASSDCVGLLTEDGRWVRRDRRGHYAILGTSTLGEVSLTSGVEGAV